MARGSFVAPLLRMTGDESLGWWIGDNERLEQDIRERD
jgi:hypothetical protein